jgi:hypothetical protein
VAFFPPFFSEAKKKVLFVDFLCSVFDMPLPVTEKRQKNVRNKIEKKWFGFLSIFRKHFSTRFFLLNLLCSVFELPSLRNTREHDTKKSENLTSKFLSIFLEKAFDMDFLQKYLYGVFELPLPRNA